MEMYPKILLLIAAVLTVVVLILIKKQPYRIINGFLLEGVIVCFVVGLVSAVFVSAYSEYAVYASQVILIVYHVIVGLIGVGLIVNGALVVKKEGRSLTHLLPFACGFLLIVSCAISSYDSIIGVSGAEWFVKLETFVSCCAGYIPAALFGVWLANDIYRKSKKRSETNYIIVLGCGIKKNGEVTALLKGRLDKAVEVFKNGGEKARFIVSGGQGSDEIISEAEAMKNYLLSVGISEEKIILENRSTTTMENLTFSKALMDDENSPCTVSTSSYHVLRSAMFSKRVGLNAQCVGGKTASYYYPAAFLREYAALIMKNKYSVIIYAAIALISFIAVF